MANLMKDNLALRKGATETKEAKAPAPRRGGGMLQNLLAQNKALRGADSNSIRN
jgi:hypothetical protein